MKHMPPVRSASEYEVTLDLAVEPPLMAAKATTAILRTRRIMRPERLSESTSLLVVALAKTSMAVWMRGVSEDWAEATDDANRAEAIKDDLTKADIFEADEVRNKTGSSKD